MKSTRKIKQNPKYDNVAIEEDDYIKEPETFEEEIQHKKWRKDMKEELRALRKNNI